MTTGPEHSPAPVIVPASDQSVSGRPGTPAYYDERKAERERHVRAVTTSASRRKVVLAGPGTGKTFLFRKVLEGERNTLTLTFVNALVDDLSLDLCGLSEVRTLHAYSRMVLGKVARKEVKIFGKLSQVVRSDAQILLGENIDFDRMFHDRNEEDRYIDFYRKRKDYYDHYGFSDVVFALVKYWETFPGKIPLYAQVVVDEFQDFNRLEVSLIDLLAQRSPVLLAGDDDQALYSGLKGARADFIRERCASPEYSRFSLPYCSRCTRVIVEAANDIISGAARSGCLKGRVSKAYRYFECPEKDYESKTNPKLIYAQVFARRIPYFIARQMTRLARELQARFSTLIISPTRVQSKGIARILAEGGLENIESLGSKEPNEPTLLDGLLILLDDNQSNLGWRIVMKALLAEADFSALLRETHGPRASVLCELVDASLRKRVRQALMHLRAVRRNKRARPDPEILSEILKSVGADRDQMAAEFLRRTMGSTSVWVADPAIRKIPIKATTIQSSKGLAEDYVFITHFDDRHFIKDDDKAKISDEDVCGFLVALTRARKRVFLISSDVQKRPTFLGWVDPARVEDATPRDCV